LQSRPFPHRRSMRTVGALRGLRSAQEQTGYHRACPYGACAAAARCDHRVLPSRRHLQFASRLAPSSATCAASWKHCGHWACSSRGHMPQVCPQDLQHTPSTCRRSVTVALRCLCRNSFTLQESQALLSHDRQRCSLPCWCHCVCTGRITYQQQQQPGFAAARPGTPPPGPGHGGTAGGWPPVGSCRQPLRVQPISVHPAASPAAT
jgi:hypothetical protein